MTGPLAVGPGPVASGGVTRRRSGMSRTRPSESASSRGGVPAPTFNLIASTTAFGPPVDISMGWDGTLWAIDASGAPHLYDPTQNQWNPYGDGVDAVTAIGDTLIISSGRNT